MIRVCLYHYDMGNFRRAWIQSVTPEELVQLQQSRFRRVIVLPEDDWYGEKSPQIIRD